MAPCDCQSLINMMTITEMSCFWLTNEIRIHIQIRAIYKNKILYTRPNFFFFFGNAIPANQKLTKKRWNERQWLNVPGLSLTLRFNDIQLDWEIGSKNSPRFAQHLTLCVNEKPAEKKGNTTIFSIQVWSTKIFAPF